MKKIIVLSIIFMHANFCHAQALTTMVSNTFGMPVPHDQLQNAMSLKDLNKDYPSSWIAKEDYVSSELSFVDGNSVIRASGEDDQLNEAQKQLLAEAKTGSTYDVEVKYKTMNSITNVKDIKTMNFSVSFVPAKEALYLGGDQQLNQYLQTEVTDKLNAMGLNAFETAKAHFIIDENGKAVDGQMIINSGNEKVDALLLDVIEKMPPWRPAEDVYGNPVQQKFQLNTGLLIGC